MSAMLAIVGGTLYTIAGGVKEGHTLLLRNGMIEAVLPPGPVPPGYQVLDASGKVVMPGLIDARTSVGLYGDGVGLGNVDHEELSEPDTAWVRAIDALNPADPAFADARKAGTTTVLAGPGTTNVAGGLSAVVRTAGDTVEGMLVRFPAGLQLTLGRPPVDAYRDKFKIRTRMGVAALLRERLTAARAYLRKLERAEQRSRPSPPDAEDPAQEEDRPEPAPGNKGEAPEPDFRLEPYAGLLRGEYPARIRVASAEDAWTALRLADEFGFEPVLEQLTEGHLAGLPEELARRGVRCVLGPMMKAGKTPETKALTFRTAPMLARAGVPLALCTGHPSRPIWSLRSEAALAVRAGLSEEVALRAITLNAAESLGLADRLGSLEPGKEADLVLVAGHPLLPTSQVTHTLIGGRVVYEAGDAQP